MCKGSREWEEGGRSYLGEFNEGGNMCYLKKDREKSTDFGV